jgi:selenocysteine lyase/cysteine desulfurase
MYKKYYSKFLEANSNVQHYACHSHHYWPDVTREAAIKYWDDSATYVDDKWTHIFSRRIPNTQKLIADVLNLSHPEQIVFAPNTHELVYRLLSCFRPDKKIKILSSDSEFYSFDRQVNRLAEENIIEIEKVSTHPFDNFETRILDLISKNDYDMIFLSHVFFNSGMILKDLGKIIRAVKNPETMIVIDGYHGFMAVPTDLKPFEDRIFYIAGAYKYAQGGEGCCFMASPKKTSHKPLYTGWFAGFSELASNGGNTAYSNDGYRFAGSTMDFTALYRLEATLTLFKNEGLTTEVIHEYIQKLQKNFRNHLLEIDHPLLCEKNIVSVDYSNHGHFFAFALPSPEHTKKLHDELRARHIWTDYRGSRLRFGFGIYQDECIDLSMLKEQR